MRSLPAAGFLQRWSRSQGVRPSQRSTEGLGIHQWLPCLRTEPHRKPLVSVGCSAGSEQGMHDSAPLSRGPSATPRIMFGCHNWGGGAPSVSWVETPYSGPGQCHHRESAHMSAALRVTSPGPLQESVYLSIYLPSVYLYHLSISIVYHHHLSIHIYLSIIYLI